MSEEIEYPSAQDAELKRLFVHMRDEDSAAAPPFPDYAGAATDVPAIGAGRGANTARWLPWGGALAAVLMLAIVVTPRQQSPDELYLEIMSANSMMTDNMMLASPGTLPEMSPFPDIVGEGDAANAAGFLN